MATTQEMLTQVETAIQALVSGGLSEYTINGRTFKKINLTEMYKWRDNLKRELRHAVGTRTSFVQF
jgi:hypothetical protein